MMLAAAEARRRSMPEPTIGPVAYRALLAELLQAAASAPPAAAPPTFGIPAGFAMRALGGRGAQRRRERAREERHLPLYLAGWKVAFDPNRCVNTTAAVEGAGRLVTPSNCRRVDCNYREGYQRLLPLLNLQSQGVLPAFSTSWVKPACTSSWSPLVQYPGSLDRAKEIRDEAAARGWESAMVMPRYSKIPSHPSQANIDYYTRYRDLVGTLDRLAQRVQWPPK